MSKAFYVLTAIVLIILVSYIPLIYVLLSAEEDAADDA